MRTIRAIWAITILTFASSAWAAVTLDNNTIRGSYCAGNCYTTLRAAVTTIEPGADVVMVICAASTKGVAIPSIGLNTTWQAPAGNFITTSASAYGRVSIWYGWTDQLIGSGSYYTCDFGNVTPSVASLRIYPLHGVSGFGTVQAPGRYYGFGAPWITTTVDNSIVLWGAADDQNGLGVLFLAGQEWTAYYNRTNVDQVYFGAVQTTVAGRYQYGTTWPTTSTDWTAAAVEILP